MKNLIVLLAAFILAEGFTVPNKKTTKPTDVHASAIYTQKFSRIVIEDDIDVSLVESSESSIDLSGSKEDISSVDWKIKNETLYLTSRSGSLKNKVLVTLSVKGLKEINVNGESPVKSIGNIRSASLRVYMNGLGYVQISNAGKIIIANGEGVKLDVKKKTANVSVISSGV